MDLLVRYTKLIFHSCALHLTIAEQEGKQILMNCGAEKEVVFVYMNSYVYMSMSTFTLGPTL